MTFAAWEVDSCGEQHEISTGEDRMKAYQDAETEGIDWGNVTFVTRDAVVIAVWQGGTLLEVGDGAPARLLVTLGDWMVEA